MLAERWALSQRGAGLQVGTKRELVRYFHPEEPFGPPNLVPAKLVAVAEELEAVVEATAAEVAVTLWEEVGGVEVKMLAATAVEAAEAEARAREEAEVSGLEGEVGEEVRVKEVAAAAAAVNERVPVEEERMGAAAGEGSSAPLRAVGWRAPLADSPILPAPPCQEGRASS